MYTVASTRAIHWYKLYTVQYSILFNQDYQPEMLSVRGSFLLFKRWSHSLSRIRRASRAGRVLGCTRNFPRVISSAADHRCLARTKQRLLNFSPPRILQLMTVHPATVTVRNIICINPCIFFFYFLFNYTDSLFINSLACFSSRLLAQS